MLPEDPGRRLKFLLFLTQLQDVDYDTLSQLDANNKATYLFQRYAERLADWLTDSGDSASKR